MLSTQRLPPACIWRRQFHLAPLAVARYHTLLFRGVLDCSPSRTGRHSRSRQKRRSTKNRASARSCSPPSTLAGSCLACRQWCQQQPCHPCWSDSKKPSPNRTPAHRAAVPFPSLLNLLSTHRRGVCSAGLRHPLPQPCQLRYPRRPSLRTRLPRGLRLTHCRRDRSPRGRVRQHLRHQRHYLLYHTVPRHITKAAGKPRPQAVPPTISFPTKNTPMRPRT